MAINFDHVQSIDKVRDMTTLGDLRAILKTLKNSNNERGLSISELRTTSLMSDSRARPVILILNVLDYISISDKIGNTVLYVINSNGITFLNDLEDYYEKTHFQTK